VDWVDGWPVVRTGRGPSTTSVHVPAAQPNQLTAYRPKAPVAEFPGDPVDASSDEFDGDTISPRWSWVREPPAATYGVEDGALRMDTQATQLYLDQNTASVLTTTSPAGDFVAETEVHLDVPAEGTGFDAVQAGLLVYGSDDSYVKLTHAASGETRQTGLAVEVPDAPAGYPRYGTTSVGPPADATWLRIVRRTVGGVPHVRGYTSRDGTTWVRGGAWAAPALADGARIGLVAMGGSGYTARFDYVHVSSLRP
jgi:arabinan endo-1,5-alpha-L-arabinosidase